VLPLQLASSFPLLPSAAAQVIIVLPIAIASPLRSEPTQSPGLTPQTLADVIANLTTYDASLFLRQFWEVQSNVYELGAGWIFWSIKHEL
jgi:hypothetical protein